MRQPFPYRSDGMDRGPSGRVRGAMMGRADQGDGVTPRRLTLRPVPLDRGGYDPGGAYWGGRRRGSRLFCAWSPSQDVVRYLDAASIPAAVASLSAEFPGVTINSPGGRAHA